jgi:hypothetical protein
VVDDVKIMSVDVHCGEIVAENGDIYKADLIVVSLKSFYSSW